MDKMPMVKKDGKMVPAFAVDGKGKMKKGGVVKAAKKSNLNQLMKKHGRGMAKVINQRGSSRRR
jgi:hypothetical protein